MSVQPSQGDGVAMAKKRSLEENRVTGIYSGIGVVDWTEQIHNSGPMRTNLAHWVAWDVGSHAPIATKWALGRTCWLNIVERRVEIGQFATLSPEFEQNGQPQIGLFLSRS